MPEQSIDPKRAVEITGPRYGSGYRIGGRLVLTARHLLTGSVDNTCQVRAKNAFGAVEAQVVWKAPGADIALVQLPKEVPECAPVVFGRLPAAGQSADIIPFELYGWPEWPRTTRPGETPKAGGRHIRGIIYLADTSPEGLLVIEPVRGPEAPDPRAQGSDWTGVSGAAVVCNGLVVAVQHHYQNPRRAASLEAEPLSKVYDDPKWRSLLEQHGIPGDPVAVLPARDQVFISYAHSDARWLERLQIVLKPLTRNKTISVWDDSKIQPGTQWKAEITKALASAKVAVLLVSQHFLASDFIAHDELPPLLQAAAADGLTILWVAVGASLYQDTEIADYQAANNPERPLDSLRPSARNKELVRIATKIREAVTRPMARRVDTAESGGSDLR